MAHLTISLLGPFEVQLSGEPVTHFASNRVRALLAYLAAEADRPHRREVLAGLLWPEWPERSARTNLRNALSNLRTAIGDREAKAPYLHITRETIQFNEASDQHVDVRALSKALETEGADEATIRRLEKAVALYRGPFLEGFSVGDSPAYDDWAYLVRERTEREALAALRRLVAYYEGRGDYRRAGAHAWRQVELEPWQEEAHRELMRLLALSGQRSTALAQYEACRRALREELNVEPGEETTRLYERIRDGKLAPPRPERGERGEETRPYAVSATATPEATIPLQPTTFRPVATPLEGERRLASVLLAQVTRSADLLETLGTEQWVEVMNGAFQVLGSEVYRYGGEVDRYRSDGLVATFGVTAAHEDDAERAVLAALAMQEVMGRYATESFEHIGLELGLTIAINTGELIATRMDDARRSREAAVMGRAIAVAERVEAVATPGAVLVTEHTYRLVRPLFEWEPAGEIAARGADEPLALYRPLAHSGIEGKGRGIPGLASPLVGRQVELSALREAIQRLNAGIGGIVTLVGEAGIGKSRLVAETKEMSTSANQRMAALADALTHLPTRPFVDLIWLEGRCLSYAVGVAYHLWLDMLRELIEVPPDAPPLVLREALQAWLRALCPDCYDDAYPYLARLLSLPVDDDLQAQLRGLGPEGLKVGTFRAVETLIESASRQAPLVLVCEDLHWADPTSLELLERLLALPDRAPVLLLCILRPEAEHGCWTLRETAARLYGHRLTDLWLEPLSTSESQTLVGNLLHVEELPQALRGRILERAEGNPFYVEEILHSLMESGTIVHDGDAGRWVGTREMDEIALPGTLHGVLMARIDRLPDETKRVLQLASVIGRVFFHRVLAAVAQDQVELDAHLLALQRGQMIRERTRLPEVEYIFKHVLTQEAAYNSLLTRDRRRYHRRTAEALETLYPDRIEEQVGLLAHHWEEAEEPVQAIPYLLRAAEQGRLAYANQEAINYYRRALALLDDASLGEQGQAWRLVALTGLGVLCHRTGVLIEAEAHFRKAIALCREMDLDPRERVRLYHLLGQVLYWQGRYEDRIRLGQEGLALLQDTRSVEAALMYQTLTGAYWMTENWESFRELALRMAGFLQDVPYEPGLRPAYLSVIDLYRYLEKDIEEATRWRQALERKARQDHDLTGLANAHRYAARLCVAQGDLDGAIPWHLQALDLYTRVGDAKESYLVQSELGVTYLELGDLGAAETYARAALENVQELGSKELIADGYVTLGRVHLAQHDWASAARATQNARRIYQETSSHWGEFWATLFLGQMCLAQGKHEAAVSHLREASALVASGELEGYPFDLAYVLGAAEDTFQEPEAFHAFCRRIQGRAHERDAGGSERAAFVQWVLEPADIRVSGQTLLCHETFVDSHLPGWVWQDPRGDCSFMVRNGLHLYAANGRDLSRLNLSAPRVTRPASGDWAAQTICGPAQGEPLPSIGGLTIWANKRNYLCLIRGNFGSHDLCFWGCLEDSDVVIGRGRLATGSSASANARGIGNPATGQVGQGADGAGLVHLRLERVGEHVRALCSADGVGWFTVGEVAFSAADSVEVGMVAIGSIHRVVYPGAYLRGTAICFESFQLWQDRPIRSSEI